MSTYSDLVIADGATSYWRLGDGGSRLLMETGDTLLAETGDRLLLDGSAATDIVNARNGTYIGNPTDGVAGAIFGDADTAVSFVQGTDQYVDTVDNNAFSLDTTNALTIEAWAFPSTTPGNYEIVNKYTGVGSGNEWRLGVSTISATRATFTGEVTADNAADIAFATSPATGFLLPGWFHVAVTFDLTNTRLILYVNGTEVARSASWSGVYTNTTTTVKIARSGSATEDFSGSLDEVAIYPSVLTGVQIRNHYEIGSNNFRRPVARLMPQLIAQ